MVTANKKSVIRVLHVDDDPSILEITQLMLMDIESSLKIDNARSVDEAFKKLATGHYDVVVSDYEMPQKDGLDFLKELREQHNKIPFILFTGKGREEVAIKALNLGVDGYFNKQGSPETVYGELCYGIIQTVDHKQDEEALIKNETALKNSEEQYRVYTENSPVAFFVVNSEGKYIQVNNAATKLLLYTKNEFLKMSIADILFEKDISIGLKQFATLKETGESRIEIALKRKDGTSVYVILNSTRLPNGNMMAFCQNINENRKTQEKALLLSSIVEDSNDAIIGKTLNGSITSWNTSAERIYGYSEDEALGKSIQMLVPPEEKEEITEILKKIGAGEQIKHYQTKRIRKDGVKIDVWLSISPIKNEAGTIIGASTIARDITERKEIIEEIARLASFPMLNPNPIVEVDFEGKVVYGNPSAKAKFVDLQALGLNHPLFANWKSVIEAFSKKKAITFVSEVKIGNDWYFLNYCFVPETRRIRIYSLNITERKKTEDKLRESIHKNELINEKLSVVGSLTRHNVGNKLVVMKSNMYLLKIQIGDNPKLAKYLEEIDSAINQSDMLFEFSRFYEKIGVEKPSNEDVFDCFNQAVGVMSNLGNVEVVNECQGLVVVADSLLMQLFYNFIDNSLKHGEKVTQIRLHYIEDADKVKLFYEDNGGGVPEANKPKLFEVGFTTGKGSGLGLYLVKKMMDVYGWTIIEDGEHGKGAKFTITIPRLSNYKKDCQNLKGIFESGQ